MKIKQTEVLSNGITRVTLDISDDPELMAMHNAIDWSLYCQCEGVDYAPTYHTDFSCPDERKHHYHCSRCGLISQVG